MVSEADAPAPVTELRRRDDVRLVPVATGRDLPGRGGQARSAGGLLHQVDPEQGGGEHYRQGENLMPAIFASKDVEEGRTAFAELREPEFSGE